MKLSVETNKIWTSVKRELSVFILDYSKLEQQIKQFINWKNKGCRGFLEAVTGFGKTFIAIIAIKRMNLFASLNTTIVVVPNSSLKQDWEDSKRGYIKIYNLKNVKVYVVNTYTQNLQKKKCNFLILDEVHRYANQESEYFSKTLELTDCNFILALSGSLTKEQKEFLSSFNLVQFGEVTAQEAEDNGWVSKHIIYNFAINVDLESKAKIDQLTDMQKSCFKKFNHDFDVARGCSAGKYKPYKGKTGEEWREQLALMNGWEGSEDHEWSPQNIANIARAWNYSVNARQKLIHNHPDKLEYCEKILNKFKKKSIVFAENTDFIDELNLKLNGESRCYHTNLKSKIYEDKTMTNLIAEKSDIPNVYNVIKTGQFKTYNDIKRLYPNAYRIGEKKIKDIIKKDFKNNLFKYILTSHALDEGFDDDAIEIALIASSKGVARIDIQRKGRAIRTKGDKISIIINLYIKESQDEKWLEKRQKGTPPSKIRWVSDISEINFELNEEEYDLKAA